MTRRDRLLLTLVLPVLVIGALWFLVFAPQRQEAAHLDEQIASAQSRLATAQGEVVRSQQAKQQLGANLAALTQAGRAVPATSSMEPLLRQLQRTAHGTGVHVRSVNVAGDATGSPAPAATAPPATGTDASAPDASATTTIDLTMSVEGRFFAMQRFFAGLQAAVQTSQDRVASTGRLLTIRSMTVSSRRGVLTAEIQASAHVLTGIAAELTEATP